MKAQPNFTTETTNHFPAWLRAAAVVSMIAGTAAAQPASPVDTDQLVDRFNSAVAGLDPVDMLNDPEAFTQSNPSGEGLDVSVNEHELVDLHVNNEDLGSVLQLLSIQSQRNIVTSQNVAATITANLYGVTFYEALDAILHVNGYGYIERGNFIYVYTTQEILEIEQAAVERVSRVVPLQFINAEDAAAFASPMLSDGGSIISSARASTFPGLEAPTGNEDYASQARIVVFDFPNRIDEIVTLLSQVDTKPTQVLIEATILQTTLTEANAFGVDFSLIADLDFSDFTTVGGPLGVANTLINGGDGSNQIPSDGQGRVAQSTVGNTSGSGGFKAGIVSNDVAVFLRLLDEVTDITVVSNPKILTLNAQPARVLVGTRVGYLNTTSTETSTTQSVEFLDTGTQLAVRPFVSNDNSIRMELRPQVSSVSLRNVTDSNEVTVTIPDEDTSEVTANVMVRDGETVVLGGLFSETTTSNRRQVPLLGDIPIIGSAFRGSDDSTRRSEIIFMVTPTIMDDQTLTLHGEKGTEYVQNARLGSRMGLLPWSRERRVSQLMVEARQLAQEGKTDEAIFRLERALALSPNSIDVIRMRDQLRGERTTLPSRSWGTDVLSNELDFVIGSSLRSERNWDWPAPDSFASTTGGNFFETTVDGQVADGEQTGGKAGTTQVNSTVQGQSDSHTDSQSTDFAVVETDGN